MFLFYFCSSKRSVIRHSIELFFGICIAQFIPATWRRQHWTLNTDTSSIGKWRSCHVIYTCANYIFTSVYAYSYICVLVCLCHLLWSRKKGQECGYCWLVVAVPAHCSTLVAHLTHLLLLLLPAASPWRYVQRLLLLITVLHYLWLSCGDWTVLTQVIQYTNIDWCRGQHWKIMS